ncbi:MAG: GNAT family N-acetyltransferase [Bacteroidota bacterium]
MPEVSTHSIKVVKAETDELYNHVFIIRTSVFVDEEEVSQDDEYDGFDHLANHYLAWYGETPAGTARWRRLNQGSFRLERFAVLPPYRRKGVGTALMKAILAELPRSVPIFVHAQVKNTAFYTKLGFQVEGQEFEEADIPHVRMTFQGD